MKRTMITMAAVAASALALAACGSAESVGGNASTGSSENGQTRLVVGSQDYYSNEIIAEVVAGLVATVLLALAIDALIQGIGWALTPWTRRGRA